MTDEWTEIEEAMNLAGLLGAKGLPAKEFDMLRELLQVWHNKRDKNMLRGLYYDGKNKLKDLGISIPPSLTNVETVIGWSAKAVDAMAVRSRFKGYTSEKYQDYLDAITDENQLKTLYSQAVTSELIHSCSFITISNGGRDEPEQIISSYSAVNAAGVWNRRLKRLEAGLAVIDLDRDASGKRTIPVWVNLYTPKATWELRKTGVGWSAKKHPHSMGRPKMVALRYRPSLDRPFGKSRIDRSVRSLNDSAVRTALRSEVTSEFFTAPQKYLLGADDSTFEEKSVWEAYIGNIFAVTENENGDVPHFGQLPQASMQPLSDYMRTLAGHFSGATNIPIAELGIVHDNPSSAQAIAEAKEPLIIDCQLLNELNADALEILARMAIAEKEKTSMRELMSGPRVVCANMQNPAYPSVVSMADSMVKLVSPAEAQWIAGTETYLRMMGIEDAVISELEAQKQEIQARQMAMMLAAQGQSARSA